jgi:hypothetical protein
MMRTNKVDKVKKSKMGNLLRCHSRGVEGGWEQRGEVQHVKACCKIHRGAKHGLGILHFLMSRGSWWGGGVKKNERDGKALFFKRNLRRVFCDFICALWLLQVHVHTARSVCTASRLPSRAVCTDRTRWCWLHPASSRRHSCRTILRQALRTRLHNCFLGWSGNSTHFVETEGSLPRSQQPHQ